MIIRPAAISDIKAIHHLVSDMEDECLDYDLFTAIFTIFLSRQDCRSRVAELDGEVVGCLNLRLEDQAHHVSKIAEIMELVIRDGYRSSGIGQALIIEAEKIARENGCLQLEVCCNFRRTRAHEFYEKQGLRKTHYKFTYSLQGDPEK